MSVSSLQHKVLESVFKFDGHICGQFVLLKLIHKSIDKAFEQLYLSNEPLTVILNTYSLPFLIRDLSKYILTSTEACKTTVLELCDQSQSDDIITLFCVTSREIILPNNLFARTSMDLFIMTRLGIRLSGKLPKQLRIKPSPYLFLEQQIDKKQYSWLEIETKDIRSAHRKWKLMLRHGFHNGCRTWKYVEPENVTKGWTCCCCLNDVHTVPYEEEYLNRYMELPCKHIFHLGCIQNVPLQQENNYCLSCPLCRDQTPLGSL